MQITTRAEAFAAGRTQYFTGKPCKHGHVTYRYVQSGTCAACISSSTGRSRAEAEHILSVDRQARRDYVVDLAELRVRCYPGDARTVLETAAAMCTAAYPSLTRDDVTVRAAPTDAAGGTMLYRLRVPVQHAQMVRDLAQALLSAHRVDLSGFHEAQAHQAAAMVPAPPALPEWGFQ
jgi:hypothetical protein